MAWRTPLRAKPSSCGEDTGPAISYLSVPASAILGPARVLFGGEQMDMEAGDDRLGGGVVWRVEEPRGPMEQRDRCWSLSSSFFSVPGREVSLLPATRLVIWAEHEALVADFCPVGLLGAHLVADGPLPGSKT